MKITRMLLRFGTMMCYFLPFSFFAISCSGLLDLDAHYNSHWKEDASILALDSLPSRVVEDTLNAEIDSSAIILSSARNENAAPNTEEIVHGDRAVDSDITRNRVSNVDLFLSLLIGKALFPTQKSISGIGLLSIYESAPGQLLMQISFAITLVLLVGAKWLNRESRAAWLLNVNLILVVAFIIDGYASDVTLLSGPWILGVMVITQLALECIGNIYTLSKFNLTNVKWLLLLLETTRIKIRSMS